MLGYDGNVFYLGHLPDVFHAIEAQNVDLTNRWQNFPGMLRCLFCGGHLGGLLRIPSTWPLAEKLDLEGAAAVTPNKARLRGLKAKLTRLKREQTKATERGLSAVSLGLSASIRETEWKISQLQQVT